MFSQWFVIKNVKLDGLDRDQKLVMSKMINFAIKMGKNLIISYPLNINLIMKVIFFILVNLYLIELVI